MEISDYNLIPGLLLITAIANAGPPAPEPFFLQEWAGPPNIVGEPRMSGDGVWVAFLCGTISAKGLCVGNTETLVIDKSGKFG